MTQIVEFEKEHPENLALMSRIWQVNNWAREQEQPAAALISHHGIYLVNKAGLPDDLRGMRFAPDQPAVLILYLKPGFVYSDKTIDWLRVHIKRAGVTLREHWNGAGYNSVSFSWLCSPDGAHPGLELINTHRRGCVPHGRSMCDCDGHEETGREQVVYPDGWH